MGLPFSAQPSCWQGFMSHCAPRWRTFRCFWHSAGPRLVQFREPEWAQTAPAEEVRAGLEAVLQVCRQAGARCLVNSVHPEDWWTKADGVHRRAQDAHDFVTGARTALQRIQSNMAP